MWNCFWAFLWCLLSAFASRGSCLGKLSNGGFEIEIRKPESNSSSQKWAPAVLFFIFPLLGVLALMLGLLQPGTRTYFSCKNQKIYSRRHISFFYCLPLRKYDPVPFNEVSDFIVSIIPNMTINKRQAARVGMVLRNGTSIAIFPPAPESYCYPKVDFLKRFLSSKTALK